MRRAWVHRFIGLLWLALGSTVVLPWAHELTHLGVHAPATASPRLSALLNSATMAAPGPAAIAAPGVAALPAAPAESDDSHTADACVVCAHLAGQHLAQGGAPSGHGAGAAYQPPAPRHGPRTGHPEPAWLIPATRAPPSLNA
ncbi:hypothetical protein [Acidovorax sp. FG27]|uniref:hypothetical protein n=1 Tax=Acidovorax sp. FG27 TaxID=3133652 RepID=UPI0030E7FD3B